MCCSTCPFWIKKNSLQIWCWSNWDFGHEFLETFAMYFSEKGEGGESKAVRSFSENSSILADIGLLRYDTRSNQYISKVQGETTIITTTDGAITTTVTAVPSKCHWQFNWYCKMESSKVVYFLIERWHDCDHDHWPDSFDSCNHWLTSVATYSHLPFPGLLQKVLIKKKINKNRLQ